MPKICDFETCRKYANYGAYHSNPTKCNEHKGEYRLVSQICIKVGCKIRSSFNFEGLPSIFCGEHKLCDMNDVNHKNNIFTHNYVLLIPKFYSLNHIYHRGSETH